MHGNTWILGLIEAAETSGRIKYWKKSKDACHRYQILRQLTRKEKEARISRSELRAFVEIVSLATRINAYHDHHRPILPQSWWPRYLHIRGELNLEKRSLKGCYHLCDFVYAFMRLLKLLKNQLLSLEKFGSANSNGALGISISSDLSWRVNSTDFCKLLKSQHQQKFREKKESKWRLSDASWEMKRWRQTRVSVHDKLGVLKKGNHHLFLLAASSCIYYRFNS